MRTNVTREFYIPANAVNVNSSKDIQVYRYMNSVEKLCAVCFVGRTIKPTWHLTFESDSKLTKYITKTITRLSQMKARKRDKAIARKANKVEAVKLVTIGDIFVECFSYESTTVDFWQVISKYNAKLELKRIAKKLVDTDSSGRNEDYMPQMDDFLDDEIINKSISSVHGDRVYLSGTSSYCSFTKWNGKPQYQTNVYWR